MRFLAEFLRSLHPILRYFFAMNPGDAAYGDPGIVALLALSAGLIILSFAVRFWRGRVENPVTKKLSRSWSSTCFWFGILGLMLTVCRVEGIQFLAMRFFWVLWALAFGLILFFQFRQFRARHYKIIPRERVHDPRDRYLPSRKSH